MLTLSIQRKWEHTRIRAMNRKGNASVTKKYEDLLKTCIFLACVEFFTIAFDVNYSVETALSDRVWGYFGGN